MSKNICGLSCINRSEINKEYVSFGNESNHLFDTSHFNDVKISLNSPVTEQISLPPNNSDLCIYGSSPAKIPAQ